MKISKAVVLLVFAFKVILLAHIVEAVLSDAAIEQTKKLIKNVCKGKTKVNEAELQRSSTEVFAYTRPLQCYMSCALGMMKVMRKSEIDVESAKKQLNALMPERLKIPMSEQLEKCKDVVGGDACEVAGNFVKCSFEVNPSSPVIPTYDVPKRKLVVIDETSSINTQLNITNRLEEDNLGTIWRWGGYRFWWLTR